MTTRKNLPAGKTSKAGSTKRLTRRRTSKYDDIKKAVAKLKNGQEHTVQVPKGIDSERYRNNLYHALREVRTDGWLDFSRSADLKSVIITFEKS